MHAYKGVEYTMKKLEEYVRSIPDFPEKGIIFRDVTSVLQDADGLHLAIETMQDLVKDLDVDVIAGPDRKQQQKKRLKYLKILSDRGNHES